MRELSIHGVKIPSSDAHIYHGVDRTVRTLAPRVLLAVASGARLTPVLRPAAAAAAAAASSCSLSWRRPGLAMALSSERPSGVVGMARSRSAAALISAADRGVTGEYDHARPPPLLCGVVVAVVVGG